MIWGEADVIIIIEIKYTVHVMCLNQPKTITSCPDPQKNDLPWNPPLVQKRLGITALSFLNILYRYPMPGVLFSPNTSQACTGCWCLESVWCAGSVQLWGSFTVLSPWSSQWCRKAEYLVIMLRPPLRARARVWILLGFTPPIFLWLHPTTVSCRESYDA